MAKAYFHPLLVFFLGLFASDRFLRHLPDFVRSRSFDHLPSSTLGTGKPNSPTTFLSQCTLLIFLTDSKSTQQPTLRRGVSRRECVSLNYQASYVKVPSKGDKNRQPESVRFGKSQNRTNQAPSQRTNSALSREILQEF